MQSRPRTNPIAKYVTECAKPVGRPRWAFDDPGAGQVWAAQPGPDADPLVAAGAGCCPATRIPGRRPAADPYNRAMRAPAGPAPDPAERGHAATRRQTTRDRIRR